MPAHKEIDHAYIYDYSRAFKTKSMAVCWNISDEKIHASKFGYFRVFGGMPCVHNTVPYLVRHFRHLMHAAEKRERGRMS